MKEMSRQRSNALQLIGNPKKTRQLSVELPNTLAVPRKTAGLAKIAPEPFAVVGFVQRQAQRRHMTVIKPNDDTD